VAGVLLAPGCGGVDEEALISRREVTAMLFAFADINANVHRIRQLLEEELDGEEGLPEDDS
jgi:hypothetical protein